MLGVNPVLCLPTDYPRQDIKLVSTSVTDFTHSPEEFIRKFYFCEYSISERERAIPHIEWLIEQLKPYATSANPKAYQELATLQFIYICLTQLHFHKTCTCPATFRGEPYKVHNYYDHLYQLGLVATFSSHERIIESILKPQDSVIPQCPPITISGETARLQYIAGGLVGDPIHASIGLTLFPLFAQVTRSLFCQGFVFIPIMRWHTRQCEQSLANRLYVRYSCNLYPPRSYPLQDFLFVTNREHKTLSGYNICLDDFDFRGSDFKQIDFRNIVSMKVADCRFTTWQSCIAPWFAQGNAKTCEGSVFTDSYYRPWINSEWGLNMVPTYSPARDWGFCCRPKFPAYTNNSCFFNMQTSTFDSACLMQ